MKEGKLMEVLPEEIWIRILETGIEKWILTHKDICSFSISCKNFNKLSNDNSLWSTLLSLDFPHFQNEDTSSSEESQKNLYKSRLEIYRQLERDFIRRTVFNQEYRLGVLGRKIKRVRRELKVINEQMEENSGVLLDMIRDRYFVCREELAYVEQEHMDIQKEVTSMRTTIMDKDGDFHALVDVGQDTNLLEDDALAGSSEDFEESSEEEPEESSEESSDGESEEGF
ncbi:hypothetical protein IFM89_011717 [Coptis chinensis]|uniref:F-box domain-containing protein n=1 Tax=Coptis chinensis TaxID=261450 RepID=A0A835IWG6_9MAGN|nr:hypothetical protein IFM89_011717 [Coptis chinensis]